MFIYNMKKKFKLAGHPALITLVYPVPPQNPGTCRCTCARGSLGDCVRLSKSLRVRVVMIYMYVF